MTTAINNNPGFLASIYESGQSGVNWISTNAKSFSANAGDTLNKVMSAVSDFFANFTQVLGGWLNASKDALCAAKDHVIALPRETKIVGAIALVATTVAGYLFGKCFNSAAAVAPAAPAAAAAAAPAAAPVANAAAAPVANAAAQPDPNAAGAPVNPVANAAAQPDPNAAAAGNP